MNSDKAVVVQATSRSSSTSCIFKVLFLEDTMKTDFAMRPRISHLAFHFGKEMRGCGNSLWSLWCASNCSLQQSRQGCAMRVDLWIMKVHSVITTISCQERAINSCLLGRPMRKDKFTYEFCTQLTLIVRSLWRFLLPCHSSFCHVVYSLDDEITFRAYASAFNSSTWLEREAIRDSLPIHPWVRPTLFASASPFSGEWSCQAGIGSGA